MKREDLIVPVLYECDEYIVVDKPQGLLVHGDGRSAEYTLADWLVDQHIVGADIGEPWTSQNGQVLPRPGIVHRLDKETSGVLVIAKTQHAYVWLKEQFKSRTVKKEYLAYVYGRIEQDAGSIDRPIGRSKGDFRKKSAQRGAVGELRAAQTAYSVIERYDAGDTVPLINSPQHETIHLHAPWSKVRLMPLTGRTHQLRVHMKAINHPIVGDMLYAGASLRTDAVPLQLRASVLKFPLPDGSEVVYTA